MGEIINHPLMRSVLPRNFQTLDLTVRKDVTPAELFSYLTANLICAVFPEGSPNSEEKIPVLPLVRIDIQYTDEPIDESICYRMEATARDGYHERLSVLLMESGIAGVHAESLASDIIEVTESYLAAIPEEWRKVELDEHSASE